MALIPAICEEILFRGFLLGAFKGESKKSKIWAVVMVGILFGIMHLNFIRIVPTAILGILFAYCALATKSIWTSVFMHFLLSPLNAPSKNPLNKISSHIAGIKATTIKLAKNESIITLLFTASNTSAPSGNKDIKIQL